MIWGMLKIAGLMVAVYGGIAAGRLAIEWIREGLERMRPPKRWQKGGRGAIWTAPLDFMSDFILTTRDGFVTYIERTKPYKPHKRETRLEAARWMLDEYPPYRSDEFEGYPIAVKNSIGSEYFFEGEWPEKRRRKNK